MTKPTDKMRVVIAPMKPGLYFAREAKIVDGMVIPVETCPLILDVWKGPDLSLRCDSWGPCTQGNPFEDRRLPEHFRDISKRLVARLHHMLNEELAKMESVEETLDRLAEQVRKNP